MLKTVVLAMLLHLGRHSIKNLPIVLLHFIPSFSSTKVMKASRVSAILDKENRKEHSQSRKLLLIIKSLLLTFVFLEVLYYFRCFRPEKISGMRDRNYSKHFTCINSICTQNNNKDPIIIAISQLKKPRHREVIYPRSIAISGGDQIQIKATILQSPCTYSHHTIFRKAVRIAWSFHFHINNNKIIQSLCILLKVPTGEIIYLSEFLSSKIKWILNAFQNFIQNVKYSFTRVKVVNFS